jgi:hypothetical protein
MLFVFRCGRPGIWLLSGMEIIGTEIIGMIKIIGMVEKTGIVKKVRRVSGAMNVARPFKAGAG